MSRLAKIRQSFRNPDGSWHLLPTAPRGGFRGYGLVQLPEIPGYVTQQQCDASLANLRASDLKQKQSWAAGVGIAGLVLGFMFGRATK